MAEHEYGEGTVRIDAATTYMIKQARYAKRKWGLTPKALELVLQRLREAERDYGSEGTMISSKAIKEPQKARQ